MDARDLSLPVRTSPSRMMVHNMRDSRGAPADHDPSPYLRLRHGRESREIRWMGSKVGREATSLSQEENVRVGDFGNEGCKLADFAR